MPEFGNDKSEHADGFADRVRAIAETIPSYEKIRTGETLFQCSSISRELQTVLSENGIETLFVAAKDDRGFLYHNYLLANKDGQTLVIDPTISQFIPAHRSVFVGTRSEVWALAAAEGQLNTDRKSDEVWSEHPVSPHRGSNPLTKVQIAEFEQKWTSTGAVRVDYSEVHDPKDLSRRVANPRSALKSLLMFIPTKRAHMPKPNNSTMTFKI